MTGTTTVKPATTNAEWARNTEKKLAADEHQTSARVGEWVLSTQAETGNLLASHSAGGSVVLANQPEATEDPDSVATNDFPAILVERVNNQQGNRGTAELVRWDTASYQSGDWGFVAPGTDLVIPVDGFYMVTYTLYFLSQSTAVNKAIFMVDGVVRMAEESNGNGGATYPSFHLARPFQLTADTIISAAAYTSGSGTFDFGASGADTSAYTSLSLVRLPVG